jgi:hypothetical protein
MLKTVIRKLIEKEVLPYSLFEKPFWYPKADVKKLQELKNKFKGKRCVIIGNGPSLNEIDLHLLKDEYTFGVNSLFLKEKEGFKPTFYTVEDSHVMNDNIEEINDFDCQFRFFPTRYKKYITNKNNALFFNMNEGFYLDYSPYKEFPRFSPDASNELFCGQSVTIINLQIAYYLGFTEIYLIGMDFSYLIPKSAIIERGNITSTEEDPNHFDGSYFGPGKKWHDPMLHNVLKSYSMCKTMYEIDGRKIYNSTVGGKLEVFERKDFKDVFGG